MHPVLNLGTCSQGSQAVLAGALLAGALQPYSQGSARIRDDASSEPARQPSPTQGILRPNEVYTRVHLYPDTTVDTVVLEYRPVDSCTLNVVQLQVYTRYNCTMYGLERFLL